MNGTVTWARTVNASQPVRGNFTIGYNGSWTEPLAWNDNAATLKQRLLALGSLFSISASNSGDANDGSAFVVAISNPIVSRKFNWFLPSQLASLSIIYCIDGYN